MKNILIVGSLNADMVIYTERMPQIGETIYGNGFEINAGGKGANQAIAIAKLGGNVKMLGCVGNDANGTMLINQCKDFGVKTDSISIVETSTGVAVITVCKGDNCIILDSGANNYVTNRFIEDNIDVIKWADIIVFQFEIPMDTILYATKKAKEYGKMVVVNPAPMCKLPAELMQYIDLFIPNRIECETLLNKKIQSDEELSSAVKELKALGIKNVIITLGSEGCIFNYNDEIKRCGVVKTDVVDTTAAGDSFVGGVILLLAQGEDINKSIEFATYTSSITVSRKGAGTSIPTYNEVREKMKQNYLFLS